MGEHLRPHPPRGQRPDFAVTARFIDGSTIALPSMSLLRAGGEVVVRGGWVTESQVAANLPQ